MSGRKRKLYMSDLAGYGMHYYRSVRGSDEHGKFTAFFLDKEPSNAAIENMRVFENVRIYRYRKKCAVEGMYFPEFGRYIIRLYDKCIKDVEE